MNFIKLELYEFPRECLELILTCRQISRKPNVLELFCSDEVSTSEEIALLLVQVL